MADYRDRNRVCNDLLGANDPRFYRTQGDSDIGRLPTSEGEIMKQGMTKRLKPKPKQETKTWQKRDAAREEKQIAHALNKQHALNKGAADVVHQG